MEVIKKAHKLLSISFLFGAIAVILGAFGAHILAESLAPKQLASFKTGVLYHFIHVIAAILTIHIAIAKSDSTLLWTARLFLIGIVLFSGSLYLLSTRELIGLFYYKWLGPLTPIGGVFFIAGWINGSIYFIKNKDS